MGSDGWRSSGRRSRLGSDLARIPIPMKAKTKATQRSLKYLRDNGWQAAIVERWQMRPQAAYGVRIDVWNFADILACRSELVDEGHRANVNGMIALVQTFPASTWKAHAAKVQEPEIREAIENWKAAGGIVLMHGWALKPKGGMRGAKKTWQLREEQI